jgi:deoxyribodipyrimidine photo-lyase
VFVGEFDELQNITGKSIIHFKEHPTNKAFKGIEESRDWMFSTKDYFPSFFKFWNKVKKELHQEKTLF